MYFKLDPRLGIQIPDFPVDYEHLAPAEQEQVLAEWEKIRSHIPDQIILFEHEIERLLETVHHTEDWDLIAACFDKIADYASRIHDLNMWRRVDPSLPGAVLHETAAEHRDREK